MNSSFFAFLADTNCIAVFDPDDLFYEHANESRRSDDFDEEDSDATSNTRPWHHPVHYVYDAAAERMKERLEEGRLNASTPGLVH